MKLKKEAVPKIIFLVLFIILIIMIILLWLSMKSKDLTLHMYKNICEKTNYTFSMTGINLDLDYSLIVSKNNDNFCIDSKSNDEHTSTLVKDGLAYYVLHSEKEYYLYDNSQIDADILKSELEVINQQDYVTGYEDINGKKYYYEEYEGIATFIMLSGYSEENSLKTRFYFEGNKIVYIKTIIDNNEEELLSVEFKDEVDENLFKIPEDYAEL